MQAKNTDNSYICELRLLGSSSVQSTSEKKEIEFPTRKAKAVFIYLATAPNMRASREKLAGMFWGRSAEEQARASLRQTLASLRKILNFNDQYLIESNSDEIYLVEEALYVDAIIFMQASDDDVSSTKHAVDLYQGEFLDGFSIKEDLFENWLREKREQFNELAKFKMASLAEYWNGSGELNKAIAITQNILSIDLLNEPAHQSLMRLYTLTGRRESAIKQYKHYEKSLKDELDVGPQKETVELYEKIVAKTPAIE